MAGYARYKNIFMADLMVLISGVFLLVAPALFIIGVLEKIALAGIAVFLLLTAFLFHAFWKETDPQSKMNEMISFNKEISLVGACLTMIALI